MTYFESGVNATKNLNKLGLSCAKLSLAEATCCTLVFLPTCLHGYLFAYLFSCKHSWLPRCLFPGWDYLLTYLVVYLVSYLLSCCLLLVTCYMLLASCYLLLAICYLLLATCILHMLLATYYSLLTTI